MCLNCGSNTHVWASSLRQAQPQLPSSLLIFSHELPKQEVTASLDLLGLSPHLNLGSSYSQKKAISLSGFSHSHGVPPHAKWGPEFRDTNKGSPGFGPHYPSYMGIGPDEMSENRIPVAETKIKVCLLPHKQDAEVRIQGWTDPPLWPAALPWAAPTATTSASCTRSLTAQPALRSAFQPGKGISRVCPSC